MMTFVLLKPDAVERQLCWEILRQLDVPILYIWPVIATLDKLTNHYMEHIDQPYYEPMIQWMKDKPMLACILDAEIRSKIGSASCPAVGTIRYLHKCSGYENLIHTSDSEAASEREIDIWRR